jgi:hypothetical protein
LDQEFTDAELEAYLDESIESGRAVEIEAALKTEELLLARLSQINDRRNAGMHTLGEIWRRNQIGVPTVEQMGNYLLGVIPEGEAAYIEFRIDTLKCPFTIAMQKDLQAQQRDSPEQSAIRRSRIFNSSAGLLKKTPPNPE